MADALLTPYQFTIGADTLSLTGTEFVGHFLVDFDIASQFPLEAVMSESPEDFPTFIRGDPQDKVVPLLITMDDPTLARINALKALFSPYRDPGYLMVKDVNSAIRRMLVKSLGLTPWKGHSDNAYVASLEAPTPIWEAAAISNPIVALSGTSVATGYDWNVTAGGNEHVIPETITFLPKSNKGHTNHYIARSHCVIAWRSLLPGVDSQGLGYPIDVTDRKLNTAALIAGGKLQADGDDLRVWVDGSEVDRWLDNLNTTGTAVWTSIPFQAAKIATLADAITSTVPGTSAELVVSNPEGTSLFPNSGYLLIDDECIYYSAKSDSSFTVGKRGMRSTTAAAHSAGASIYWVEHEILLVYDYTAAANPPTDSDVKPIIDLSLSNNLRHVYRTTDGFISPTTLRTGQWLRELRGDTLGSAVTRLSQSAGIITVEDDYPAAGAPNFDSLSLYVPCLAESGITGVAFDYECDHDMLFEIYGADEEGFESRLLRRDCRGENWPLGTQDMILDSAIAYANGVAIDPGALLSRLTFQGRNYRVTGGIKPSGSNVVGPTPTRIAQAFDLASAGIVNVISADVSRTVGGDRLLNADIYTLGGSGPVQRATPGAGSSSITLPALPTPQRCTMFLEGQVEPGAEQGAIPAGDYAVVFTRTGGTVGEVHVWGASSPFYSGGSRWNESAGPVWTEDADQDLSVVVCSPDMDQQPDCPLGLGTTVRWRNVSVQFHAATIPKVVIGAEEECYLIDGTLDNFTTGQSLRILIPTWRRSFAGLLISPPIHVAAESRGTLQPFTAALWAAEPSDIAEWFRLNPGVNAMRWTEASIGSARIDVQIDYRDRWT